MSHSINVIQMLFAKTQRNHMFAIVPKGIWTFRLIQTHLEDVVQRVGGINHLDCPNYTWTILSSL